jgi:flagellar basal-body rod protein FlgB
MKPLFGKTIDLLTMMADFRAQRHQVITSNITNMDTTGYRPADLTFRENLNKAMEEPGRLSMSKTNGKHLSHDMDGKGRENFEVVGTGDKVGLDTEMANLAENHLMYNLTVDLLARKFRGLNTVLKETK